MNHRFAKLLFTLWVGVIAGTARADDGSLLKYKFEKGGKTFFRSKTEMKQTQNFAGMTLENSFNTESISSITTDSVDEKGISQVSIKGERMKIKAAFGPLGDFVFDSQSSDRDKSSVIGAAVTPLFERLSGSVYEASIAPDGEVLQVRGYAELLKDLVEGNPLAAQFAGGGSNEAARQGLADSFPRLSKVPVKVGDTWEVPFEIPLPNLGKTKGKSVFRYAGPDKVGDRITAKIEVTSETSVDLNIEMDGAKITGTISTTSGSGTIQFDVASGRVLSHQSKVALAGTLNINANGMDILLTNEQSMSSTTEYLEKLPE